jgi:hypothetical protein
MSNPLLPNWIVQPFNLRFEPDDLHVMAYFSDHPEYEAAEAMIRIRTMICRCQTPSKNENGISATSHALSKTTSLLAGF